MEKKGILFSGSERNAALAKNHVDEHGIVYWCHPSKLRYQEYKFPIIGLLHVKERGVRYKCIINDVMDFNGLHFKDEKKKPKAWIKEYKIQRRKYEATFTISKMTRFDYQTTRLKKWEGGFVRIPPRKHTRIIIP